MECLLVEYANLSSLLRTFEWRGMGGERGGGGARGVLGGREERRNGGDALLEHLVAIRHTLAYECGREMA